MDWGFTAMQGGDCTTNNDGEVVGAVELPSLLLGAGGSCIVLALARCKGLSIWP